MQCGQNQTIVENPIGFILGGELGWSWANFATNNVTTGKKNCFKNRLFTTSPRGGPEADA